MSAHHAILLGRKGSTRVGCIMRIQVVEVIIGRLFLVLATLPLEVWASSASSGSSRHGRSTTTTTSPTATTTSRSSTTRRGRDGIPRSRRSSSSYSLSNGEVGGDDHDDHRWMVYPPWNPSRNISDDGFISGVFERIPGEWETEVRLRTAHTLNTPCRIRQVPGDGNCLFHRYVKDNFVIRALWTIEKTYWGNTL